MGRGESFFSQTLKLSPFESIQGNEPSAGTPKEAGANGQGLSSSSGWSGTGEGVSPEVRAEPVDAKPSADRVPGSPEDSMLIKRLSAGDEEALGTLMDRYGGAVLHFAHRLTGDLQLAEEIWQDTMLKAWQQATSFRVDGHLKAWLFRVARNNAIDHMRKKRVATEEYTTCLDTQATTFRPEREAERSWLSTEVVEAMEELPAAYREVVNLRFFSQLCYQEIAQMLQIPLGTVKSRLNYAIQRLTKILRDKGIDPSFMDP